MKEITDPNILRQLQGAPAPSTPAPTDSGYGDFWGTMGAVAKEKVINLAAANVSKDQSNYAKRQAQAASQEAGRHRAEAGWGTNLAADAATFAPAAIAALLPGRLVTVPALTAAATGADILTEQQKLGQEYDTGKAAKGAAATAALAMIAGGAPAKTLLGKIGKTAGMDAAMGAAEQMAVNYGTSQDMTQDIAETALASVVGGGVIRGAGKGIQKVLGKRGESAISDVVDVSRKAGVNPTQDFKDQVINFENEMGNRVDELSKTDIESSELDKIIDDMVEFEAAEGGDSATISALKIADEFGMELHQGAFNQSMTKGLSLSDGTDTNVGERLGLDQKQMVNAARDAEQAHESIIGGKGSENAREGYELKLQDAYKRAMSRLKGDLDDNIATAEKYVDLAERSGDPRLAQFKELLEDTKRFKSESTRYSSADPTDAADAIKETAKRFQKNAARLGVTDQFKGVDGVFSPVKDMMVRQRLNALAKRNMPTIGEKKPNLGVESGKRGAASLTDLAIMSIPGGGLPMVLAKKIGYEPIQAARSRSKLKKRKSETQALSQRLTKGVEGRKQIASDEPTPPKVEELIEDLQEDISVPSDAPQIQRSAPLSARSPKKREKPIEAPVEAVEEVVEQAREKLSARPPKQAEKPVEAPVTVAQAQRLGTNASYGKALADKAERAELIDAVKRTGMTDAEEFVDSLGPISEIRKNALAAGHSENHGVRNFVTKKAKGKITAEEGAVVETISAAQKNRDARKQEVEEETKRAKKTLSEVGEKHFEDAGLGAEYRGFLNKDRRTNDQAIDLITRAEKNLASKKANVDADNADRLAIEEEAMSADEFVRSSAEEDMWDEVGMRKAFNDYFNLPAEKRTIDTAWKLLSDLDDRITEAANKGQKALDEWFRKVSASNPVAEVKSKLMTSPSDKGTGRPKYDSPEALQESLNKAETGETVTLEAHFRARRDEIKNLINQTQEDVKVAKGKVKQRKQEAAEARKVAKQAEAEATKAAQKPEAEVEDTPDAVEEALSGMSKTELITSGKIALEEMVNTGDDSSVKAVKKAMTKKGMSGEAEAIQEYADILEKVAERKAEVGEEMDDYGHYKMERYFMTQNEKSKLQELINEGSKVKAYMGRMGRDLSAAIFNDSNRLGDLGLPDKKGLERMLAAFRLKKSGALNPAE